MLDHIGTVALFAAIIVNFGAFVMAMPGGPVARLSSLTIAGLWTGLAVALAGSGALLGNVGIGPMPPVGVTLSIPLFATAAAAALSPAFRTMLLALPTRLLIGLNTIRILGVFFLLLAAQNRLAGPFPYSAGWGDIVTGALAVPLIAFMARAQGSNSAIPQAWNWFGAVDLFAAIAFGVMSSDGSPLQVFQTGIAGPLPVQSLPWSLIPTVLVPFYLILHGIIHAQLRRAPVGSAAQVGGAC